jgi:hypothetical protein
VFSTRFSYLAPNLGLIGSVGSKPNGGPFFGEVLRHFYVAEDSRVVAARAVFSNELHSGESLVRRWAFRQFPDAAWRQARNSAVSVQVPA